MKNRIKDVGIYTLLIKISLVFGILVSLSIPSFAININVKDFGAKGDGKTDDRSAIQAAINKINEANGGILNFPEGTYLVTCPLKSPEWIPQIKLCNNLKIRGVGIGKSVIKVADNQGAWDVIFSNEAVHDFSMMGISMDGNGSTNPVESAVDAVPSPWFHTFIYLPNSKNIAIQSCQFTNLSGVWAIYALKRAENLVIDNCIFDNIGGYTKNDWDHSCIRIDGHGPVVVSNNIMKSQFGAGTTGTRTAVEIHGSNHKFINNTISGFRSGVNVCSGGDDKKDEPSVHQYYIGNTMVNVGSGFNIWGIENRTFDNLVFERNDITIDQTAWKDIYPEFFGIGLVTYNPDYCPILIENMKILDNNITFINTEGGNKYSFGLRLVSNNLDSPNDLNDKSLILNSQISRNTISGSYLNGIYLNCKTKNLEISENIIINSGLGSSETEWKSAIKLVNKLDNVSIKNNRFYSQKTTQNFVGIYDSSTNLGNCFYIDNQLIGTMNQSKSSMYMASTLKKGLAWKKVKLKKGI